MSIPVIDELSKESKLFTRLLKERPTTFGLTKLFDDLLKTIEQIIVNRKTVRGHKEIVFEDVVFYPPYMLRSGVPEEYTPFMAQQEGNTYFSEIRASIIVRDIRSGKYEKTKHPVVIGAIPVMVGSSICTLSGKSEEEIIMKGGDHRGDAGYFVIDGVLRTSPLGDGLAINKYRMSVDRKSGELLTTVTAESYKGSMPTTLRVIQNNPKKETRTRFIHIDINAKLGATYDTTKRPKHSMNVLKAIKLYLELSKDDLLGDDEDEETYGRELLQASKDPYALQEIILGFVKPERHSAVKTALADTIIDAVCVDNAVNYLSSVALPATSRNTKLRRDDYATLLQTLNSSILPHMASDDPAEKVNNLCMMIAMCCEYMAGFREVTNRDSWSNKRLTTISKKCEQLFRKAFRNWITKTVDGGSNRKIVSKMKETKKGKKKYDAEVIEDEITLKQILDGIQKSFILTTIVSAFKSPTYGANTLNVTQDNPIQQLKEDTFLKKLAMLNRITVPGMSLKGNDPNVRAVKGSAWGMVCPGTTVESAAAGITTEKAVTAQSTSLGDPDTVAEVLFGELGIEIDGVCTERNLIGTRDESRDANILINGIFKGWGNGDLVRETVILARRQGVIDRETSVVYDREDGYVLIHCDENRLARPLLILNPETMKPIIDEIEDGWNLTFNDLVVKGAIEYIDAYEQTYIRVAVDHDSIKEWEDKITIVSEQIQQAKNNENKSLVVKLKAKLRELTRERFTHMEIHPSAEYGISPELMPYLPYNQAPRITYQTQMASQAMGTYNVHFAKRMADAKVALMADTPLVTTHIEDYLDLKRFPQGVNLTLAFLDYEGGTVEDAFLVKDSVATKTLRITMYYVIKVILDPGKYRLGRPKELMRGEDWSQYQFILNNGLPAIGAPLKPGDCVLGKATKISRGKYKMSSIKLKQSQYGVVDNILVTKKDGKDVFMIKMRIDRPHYVGDKLSSRFAQKGTTSRIVPEEEMPFDELTGETPDIIQNTHSIPKRMTIGLLREMVAGLYALRTGKRVNATMFEKMSMEDLYRELERLGIKGRGYRYLVNPHTGTRMRARIFMGPAYFQMLHHLGREKLQIRSRGQVSSLTRQPRKGEGRRVGEMERDAFLSHGATAVMMERFHVMSDAYTTPICERCGFFATLTPSGSAECGICEGRSRVVKTTIPYAFKLLSQIIMAMRIKIPLNFKFEEEEDEFDDNDVDEESDEEESDYDEDSGLDDYGLIDEEEEQSDDDF